MTVYVAGPMTGIPEFNYPAFNAAAVRLRAAGLVVANPAEYFAGATDLPYGTYIREAVRALVHCLEVVVLPGWENSRGARLEVDVARAIGMPVTDLEARLTIAAEHKALNRYPADAAAHLAAAKDDPFGDERDDEAVSA